jgi:asparagine synthase (glutamine-hydrolysing)
MCGICGIAYYDKARCAEGEMLSAMCELIRHRGPDEQGIHVSGPVGLGSTRLSIIDVKGGHMPLSNEDKTVWITYNGEVYNFPELRKRLQASGHRFSSHTDTEAIVHLYEEEGENFLQHLKGMFAIAIWDERKGKLLLARDRIGIKPLYYAQLHDRFVFGSELQTLYPAGVEREVDRLALHDYLSLNYVPGPRTILKGVRKLPPGHLLICHPETGRMEVKQYWDFPPPEETQAGRPLAEIEAELLKLLRTVVRETMISDVPIGAFLSGGIDSSLVVALMSEVSNRPIKTFSAGFNERSYNELPYAKLVAERFRTEYHEMIVEPQIQDLIDSLLDHFDEPFADNSAVATYLISQMAASQVKVVLSGDGGDEVFGGYNTYQADQLARIYRRLSKQVGSQLIPWAAELLPTSFKKGSFDFRLKRFVNGASLPPLGAHYAWKAYLNEEMKSQLYAHKNGNGKSNGLRPTVDLFQRHYLQYPSEDMLNRLLYVDTKVQLADCFLTKVDRMSMAHSLEVRVPLLDRRIVEFMAGLPSHYKVRGLTLKYLLKRVAKGLLPPEILHRRKGGFSIPIAGWLATDLHDMVMDEFTPARLEAQGFFDPKAVTEMVEAHCRGKCDFSRSIWTLFVFSRWCDRNLQGGRIAPHQRPGVTIRSSDSREAFNITV